MFAFAFPQGYFVRVEEMVRARGVDGTFYSDLSEAISIEKRYFTSDLASRS